MSLVPSEARLIGSKCFSSYYQQIVVWLFICYFNLLTIFKGLSASPDFSVNVKDCHFKNCKVKSYYKSNNNDISNVIPNRPDPQRFAAIPLVC